MKTTAHSTYWPPRLPKELTIHETTLFDNLAITTKKYPTKTAIEYYGNALTYEDILNDVEKMAGYLESELGMQKGDNVLLFMQNSPQYIISMFAVLRIRAVVVPINPMSTTSDFEFFVNDGDVKHALIGQELYEKAAPLVENKTLEHTIIAAYSDYANADKALDTLPEEVA